MRSLKPKAMSDTMFAGTFPLHYAKAQGMFLGLAIGDAIGALIAGANRADVAPVSARTGSMSGNRKDLAWSTPTGTACALGFSLAKANGFDAKAAMDSFLASEKKSCINSFSPSMTTALNRYRETGRPFAGPEAADHLDSGALVRVAPVVVAEVMSVRMSEELAGRQSRLTHIAADAVAASEVLAMLMHFALAGIERKELFRPWQGEWPDGVARVMRMEHLNWPQHRIDGTDSAIDSLRAALWVVARARSYSEAILSAANFGGDNAVATTAVVGQLAGAICGISGIPEHWQTQLVGRMRIVGLTGELFDQAVLRRYDREEAIRR